MSVFFVHDLNKRIVTPLDRKFSVRDIPPATTLDEIAPSHNVGVKDQQTLDKDRAFRQQRKLESTYGAQQQTQTQHSLGLVRDIMTREVFSHELGDTLGGAWQTMKAHSIHHLGVTDEDGRLWGLISARSILPAFIEQPDRSVSETILEDLCDSQMLSCSPDTEIPDLAQLFLDYGLDGITVIDNHRLVGLVTSADIIKLILRVNPLEVNA